MRKASFSVKTAKENSTAHNSREKSPKYLIEIDKNFNGNFYVQFIDDKNYLLEVEKLYKAKVGQRMQRLHVKNLIKETVISLEDYHSEKDVIELFKGLNKRFGGHELLELSIHRDEGYFLKDGISYYPTKDILFKDGSWFIKSDDLKKDFTNEDFNIKVDINDYEKVLNLHAHAKFSMFDKSLSKNARMQKKDMSERIKFVADFLKLDYSPDSKTRYIQKSVGQVKEEHHHIRNIKKNEGLAKQKDLKKEISDLRLELKENKATRPDYAKLEKLNKELKQKIKDKALTVEALQEKIKSFEYSLLNSKKENNELKENNNRLINQNKVLKTENKNLGEELVVFKEKIVLRQDMSDYEDKSEKIFLELDKILITTKEREKGKEYLKGDELIKRVSIIKKENNWFRDQLNEINRLFNKPLNSYKEIIETIKFKIQTGYENIFEKLKTTTKEINEEMVKNNLEKYKTTETLKTKKQSFRKKRY